LFNSIRTKVFFSLLFIVTFVIIITAGLFFNFESQYLREHAIEHSLAINKLQAQIIGKKIETHMNQLLEYSEYEKVVELNRDELHDVLEYIQINRNTDFFNSFYFNKIGEFQTIDGAIGYIGDREYYKAIMKDRLDSFISEPLIGRARHVPEIVLAVAINKANGDIVGGLGGTIQLDLLSENVKEIDLLPSSYSWIVSSEGNFIAHPEIAKYLGENMNDVEKLGFNGLADIWKDMKLNEYGHGEYFDLDANIEKIMTYYEIPSSNGWKLAITTFKTDVYAPIIRLTRIIIGISLGLIIILIFTTYVWSKKLVSPIISFTKAVEESKNDITEVEGISASYEIEKLISVYNRMAKSIHNYTNKLEHMVKERTDELNELNLQLDQRNKKLINLNDELYTLARTDELTQILNRNHINEQIEEAILKVKSHTISYFSILFIDLDNFKYYTDTFGHDIGDKILIDMANMMKRLCRDTDIIGRYGGDEFIVLLNNTDINQAKGAMKKFELEIQSLNGYTQEIKEWVGDSNVIIADNKKLGVSIGLSFYDINSEKSLDDIVKQADERMYDVKNTKKNNKSKL